MDATSTILSSSFLFQGRDLSVRSQNQKLFFVPNQNFNGASQKKRASFRIKAAKPPGGVEILKVEPQFRAPFLGFTKTAEVWSSRACMIGITGVFVVELILNMGITSSDWS